MHDSINLTALLNNTESWNLYKGEKVDIEQIEINAIKLLFDLPSHTPTPALIYSFGLLYTSLRVEQKQLIYLWKVINRNQHHWTQIALNQLMSRKIGWGKSIHDTLTAHNLPTQTDAIKTHSKGQWTNIVKTAIEKRNKERLIQDCHKTENGENKRKSKTAHIVDKIKDPAYRRGPLEELTKCTKLETKTILLSRFRMLECGNNFKGSYSANCNVCDTKDDEKHRMNYCSKFRTTNNYDCQNKIEFDKVFSVNIETLRDIIPKISQIWNARNANGTMLTD